MDRLLRNDSFLRKLSNAKRKTLYHLIKYASDDEIKVLYEIVYNLKTLDLGPSEKKTVQSKLYKLRKFFLSKWSLKRFKRFLLSHVNLIPYLISLIFTKVLD